MHALKKECIAFLVSIAALCVALPLLYLAIEKSKQACLHYEALCEELVQIRALSFVPSQEDLKVLERKYFLLKNEKEEMNLCEKNKQQALMDRSQVLEYLRKAKKKLRRLAKKEGVLFLEGSQDKTKQNVKEWAVKDWKNFSRLRIFYPNILELLIQEKPQEIESLQWHGQTLSIAWIGNSSTLEQWFPQWMDMKGDFWLGQIQFRSNLTMDGNKIEASGSRILTVFEWGEEVH